MPIWQEGGKVHDHEIAVGPQAVDRGRSDRLRYLHMEGSSKTRREEWRQGRAAVEGAGCKGWHEGSLAQIERAIGQTTGATHCYETVASASGDVRELSPKSRQLAAV